MFRVLSGLLVVVLLGGCAENARDVVTRIEPSGVPVNVIYNDTGGPVAERTAMIKKALERNEVQEIRNTCNSSCARLLSLPPELVCVSRTATIRLHAPHWLHLETRQRRVLSDLEFERETMKTARHFDSLPWLQERYLTDGRYRARDNPYSNDMLTISGRDLIKHDGVREC